MINFYLYFNDFLNFVANCDLDDDFLHDPRYTEVFKETYLRPVGGRRVMAIQPGINTSVSTFVFVSFDIVSVLRNR